MFPDAMSSKPAFNMFKGHSEVMSYLGYLGALDTFHCIEVFFIDMFNSLYRCVPCRFHCIEVSPVERFQFVEVSSV